MRNLIQSIVARANRRHSARSYEAIIERNIRLYKGDREMAIMASIGSLSRDDFAQQGDGHVEVLRHHGLQNDMSVYDLGCGAGRTAIALRRSGWKGHYRGADIVKPLVKFLLENCPEYEAIVHRELTILAEDNSLDIAFHWSVFTHLYPEECYIYLLDIFRALKPGGKLIFSFLELEDERHRPIFLARAKNVGMRGWSPELDTFLHRDWISWWANKIGFEMLEFTDGSNADNHAEFWQALVVMKKPASV